MARRRGAAGAKALQAAYAPCFAPRPAELQSELPRRGKGLLDRASTRSTWRGGPERARKGGGRPRGEGESPKTRPDALESGAEGACDPGQRVSGVPELSQLRTSLRPRLSLAQGPSGSVSRDTLPTAPPAKTPCPVPSKLYASGKATSKPLNSRR